MYIIPVTARWEPDVKQKTWVCLKTTRRLRTPQNAYSYEMPMCYCMFHTSVYELKTMNERKIQQKYKIQTAKNTEVTSPLQDATGRHRPPQDVAKCLAAV